MTRIPADVESRDKDQPSLDTAGMISSLNACSPDAIKSWLEAKGFKLVNLNLGAGEQTALSAETRHRLVSHTSGADTTSTILRVESEERSNPSNTPNDQREMGGPTNVVPRKRARVNATELVDLTADDPSEANDKPTAIATIRFSNQGIEAHGLVALPKYFAAKMTTLDAYIPLSVFNTQWLRQDLLQQSLRKRSVKEKLEDTYIGLTVPLEWKMTFGEWVVAFDLFITYLEYYKWGELATKFRGHKENVFAVKRENSNWPVAFRYDLAVRMAVMTFRLPDGSVANPSIRDARIKQEAIRETERLKDFLPAFKEVNPYADGEVKAFIDPITGIDSRNGHPPTNHTFHKPSVRSQAFSQQNSFNNLPVYEGPGGSSSNMWEDRRSDNYNNRFRNRRGSWNGTQSYREKPVPRRRFNGGNEGGRREERRDDSRDGGRDNADLSGKTK